MITTNVVYSIVAKEALHSFKKEVTHRLTIKDNEKYWGALIQLYFQLLPRWQEWRWNRILKF